MPINGLSRFNGLSVVNIELTSRCNKECWMCGRRKLEKLQLTDWGDMELEMAIDLASQIPDDIIVQFHSNGEPLLYPYLSVFKAYKDKIRCLDTNAKLLLEKADDIIENVETLTISVVENDPEGDEQYEIVKKFLRYKKARPPFVVYRMLGTVANIAKWHDLPGLVITRILHNPMGSYGYEKKVTIPEHGICLDLLNHLVIDRYGDVYTCVRFNPNKYNKLGNIKELTLAEMWNGKIRKKLIREHMKGNRNCSELCSKCEFYGVPTS
jgi:radical SAM protein with 4Fe4S-binding SPASM domain